MLVGIVDYLLASLLGYLADFFAWVWDWVVIWFQDAFDVISQWLIDLAESNGIDIDPSSLSNKIDTFAGLLESVNYWLPVKAVFAIFVAEWAVRLSMRAVRWIIGFIPTIEG
ncbi:MAG: hypothetical protein ACF8OB_12970 [Phycisphaeraceae bacterium JB051]